MKILCLLLIFQVFAFSAFAGTIPTVLPEKRSPGSVEKKKVTAKPASKKKAKKRVTTRSTKKSSKVSKSKPTVKRTKRTTASAAHATIDDYFKKETLATARDSSSAALPPRAKVGIKHSVRQDPASGL